MEFSTQTTAALHQIETAALAVGVFTDSSLSPSAEAIDKASSGAIRKVLGSEFQGKAGSQLVLRDLPGVSAARVVLVGLGKRDAYNAAAHAKAEQTFARYCTQAGLTEAVTALTVTECADTTLVSRAQASAIAAGQAAYRYDTTLGKPEEDAKPALEKWTIAVSRNQASEAQQGLKTGQAIANGVNLTRLLGDLPPNVCTPTYLGETAKSLANEFPNLTVQVLAREQIEELGMGSFLSVARGSYEPPAFIILEYTPSGSAPATPSKAARKTASKAAKSTAKTANKAAGKTAGKAAAKSAAAATVPADGANAPIVLVGKGITFDAGGISLKPAANMDEMKYDMCGAASVLGTFRALAELQPARRVVGLIPACENLPSGRANKPGDVVTSMSGKTIEILNTDAEGRLVLCDALTYAERYNPAVVIDIATLTGACVIALGHHNTGLFTKDDELAEILLHAGRQANDTAWRLPLEDAYQEQLRSNFADMANVGGRDAGSITAACFLARFTDKYRWAHLDIAGTAWRSGKDKGASGRPVPLLVQFLQNFA